MTEQTQTTTTPAKTAASGAGKAAKTAAKKAAAPGAGAAKTAAKKAAEKTEAPARKDARNVYLPALPDGFDYTGIEATGPNGEVLRVQPATGDDVAKGSFTLSLNGAGIEREANFADVKSAASAVAKGAKAMADVSKREAALAEARAAALDL